MAGRFLCGLCCSAMVACSIGSLAQSAGRDAAGTDPRNFDATEYGERVVLGPKWLFAPGDNPTWATPAFDDSGWTTISTDKQLLEYDIGNNSYVWYRMHVHLSPHTHNLMVGTRVVSGRYEIFANGFRIGGQVGGDFFQFLPLKSGGVLVVIGDVSGKGMPAAMTVSLLVGTVRTLAHYTQNPGEILAAMNQRMLARSSGGFTTCLVVRADANGKLTVANAGHISPYLGGNELALENGLPLGLSAETTYAESTFQLSPNQQLTLLTDGVVEARDHSGALYGFERAAALSIETPEAIAGAAQAFGQEDDITVLSLSYAGVPASA